jgi:hypothetical protein
VAADGDQAWYLAPREPLFDRRRDGSDTDAHTCLCGEAAVAEALAEARRLAAAETDEPAALFFACARRSRAVAGAAGRIAPFAARSHARSLGLELTIEDLELEILRARIAAGSDRL